MIKDPEQLITPHFKRKELACRCGCGKLNMPRSMLDFIERVRNNYGLAMVINSAVRCAEHNFRVGGEAKSHHLDGLAIDVACNQGPLRHKLLGAAILAGAKGIGVYKWGFHFDIATRIGGGSLWIDPLLLKDKSA